MGREDSFTRDQEGRVAYSREESCDADEKSFCKNYKQPGHTKHYRKDYDEDGETETAAHKEKHAVVAGCENIKQRVWRDALFRFRERQREERCRQQVFRWKVSG